MTRRTLQYSDVVFTHHTHRYPGLVVHVVVGTGWGYKTAAAEIADDHTPAGVERRLKTHVLSQLRYLDDEQHANEISG